MILQLKPSNQQHTHVSTDVKIMPTTASQHSTLAIAEG